MTLTQTRPRDADLALAARDDALPCLATVLDDDRLSGLAGEQLRVTRVRYKPRTSALVAFVRTRNGHEDFGWALTRAPDGNVKLYGRAHNSATHGGGMRLFLPDMGNPEAIVAVGGVDDDWDLRRNLRWLGRSGLEQLGAVPVPVPGPGLLSGSARVLRYKPERRLVLMQETPGGSIVIKVAARPVHEELELLFHQRLQLHGVPVLPRLGGQAFPRHGISASPAWGDGDLLACGDHNAAHRAGETLARLHGIPVQADSSPDPRLEGPLNQLKSTHAMVRALVPALNAPAAKVAARIRRQLEERPGHRAGALVHGDFSADQVLVSGAEVRLIDFDRSHYGVREEDLGSFAAVEELSVWRGHADASRGRHTEALFDGYAHAGGRFAPAAVQTWTALRMFCSCVDPFRDRTPEWAAEMARQIDRAAELVP
ncbi:phosphotransferase family protein [Arthrobacter sp. CG_A4]|uniref:phosphotransferase family protein n=1 Tax=Arthrobacter sp. CG_A4 TaxID=3071706 RepID=UPI002DF76716|nr:Ser/Thr protein kinase RdoA (MazF antagonist) [Arthrobacter sp. CG_A4]